MKIAISGGIGSGKSVIARMLKEMEYPVYDCDERARCIMDESREIKQRLCDLIHPDSVDETGCIDRRLISSIVFSDPEKLQSLNSIVHEAVRKDISEWSEIQNSDKPLFIETAILYQSGIDRIVDYVMEIYAPEEIRIDRIVNRNGISPEEAKKRIESQSIAIVNPHPHIFKIDNSGDRAVLPALLDILRKIKKV